MFTGLVEQVGTIRSITAQRYAARLTISADRVLEGSRIGDSIAVNGVCLTVTEISPHSFSADIMPETMRRSNLYGIKAGKKVNLERACALGQRLGGHLVSGHIDGMATIISMKRDENAIWIDLEAGDEIISTIVEKGSVALDGISLTVAKVQGRYFSVSIIPHTAAHTTLHDAVIGQKVNCETDLIGKYVIGYLSQQNDKKSGIDREFLARYGF